MNTFSVKMRSSLEEKHISGAERIVTQQDISDTVSKLTNRALHHSLGEPDFINIKIEAVAEDETVHLSALPVTARECSTPEESFEIMKELLSQIREEAENELTEESKLSESEIFAKDQSEAVNLVELLKNVRPMRGAVLYDMATGQRIEPDSERGIRVTYMDASSAVFDNKKNHFREALILATKVANAPGMLAEICISDDPDYVTGYFASKKHGYVRLTPLKEKGSSHGGRVFICDTRLAEASQIIDYLEKKRVLVDDIPVSAEKTKLPVERIQKELERLEDQNLYRKMKTIETAQYTNVSLSGNKKLLLSSNNYLNMATEPRVCQAAANAVLKWGAGSGGSRLTTGNVLLHEELEQALAKFKHREAACLFNTGYMANVGIISALMDGESVIFSDEFNHASIIDGCRLSRAKIVVYKHNDMKDLEDKIKHYLPKWGLLVSDAVFSMDGDIVNLPEFVRLGKKYNLITMIDEAHATGVIGKTGRGAEEYFGGGHKPDIIMGTLSKALGTEGGFACGSSELIEYLRNKARSFIFSTSQCPASLAGALEALHIIEAEPEHVEKLQHNVEFFCEKLKQQGLDISSKTPIIPIVIGDEKRAMNIAKYLEEHGLMVPAIRYPTVAKGSARLRVALMAEHTDEELSFAAALIGEACRNI